LINSIISFLLSYVCVVICTGAYLRGDKYIGNNSPDVQSYPGTH